MIRVTTYARLVKFSHTVFAMPFALLAAFLAGAAEDGRFARAGWFWARLSLVVLCMAAARSAAMAFNRIVDVRLDAANPRTRGRPLQRGELTTGQAWAFFACCCAAFLAAAAAFLAFYGNVWPLALAVPLLALLCLYSFTKRFTCLCHLFLGAALGASAPAAYVAVSPQTFSLLPVALGAAVLCWVAGFDIIYSLQDLAIDLRLGLHSIPAALGPAGGLWVSRSAHLTAATLLLVVWALSRGRLGAVYLGGVAVAAAAMLAQQLLVRPRGEPRVNAAAFLACNGTVSIALGAAGMFDAAWPHLFG